MRSLRVVVVVDVFGDGVVRLGACLEGVAVYELLLEGRKEASQRQLS